MPRRSSSGRGLTPQHFIATVPLLLSFQKASGRKLITPEERRQGNIMIGVICVVASLLILIGSLFTAFLPDAPRPRPSLAKFPAFTVAKWIFRLLILGLCGCLVYLVVGLETFIKDNKVLIQDPEVEDDWTFGQVFAMMSLAASFAAVVRQILSWVRGKRREAGGNNNRKYRFLDGFSLMLKR